MDKIKFVNFPLQYNTQKESILKILEDLLNRGDFILGEAVSEFEKKIAEYCGVKYALGVNSGTDALVISMRSFGIGQGDEVITVANSFISTAGSILECGAKPVFVDVEDNYLINPDKIEQAITERTKAIIPVHLTGKVSEMDRINEIARSHGLIKVIEDSCQAIGAEYNRKRAGSLGDIGCFSLHPLKNLNVLGDGGFITTDNEDIYETIKRLRNHGLKNRNEADYFGYNSRLDTFQAAVALNNLDKIDRIIQKRKKNANLYKQNLQGVRLPEEERQGCLDTYHLFVICSPERDKLQKYLKKNGIDSVIHYPIPIHLQKAAKQLGYKKGDLPKTETQAEQILSLPIHQDLREEEIMRVAKTINKFNLQNGTEERSCY